MTEVLKFSDCFAFSYPEFITLQLTSSREHWFNYDELKEYIYVAVALLECRLYESLLPVFLKCSFLSVSGTEEIFSPTPKVVSAHT